VRSAVSPNAVVSVSVSRAQFTAPPWRPPPRGSLARCVGVGIDDQARDPQRRYPAAQRVTDLAHHPHAAVRQARDEADLPQRTRAVEWCGEHRRAQRVEALGADLIVPVGELHDVRVEIEVAASDEVALEATGNMHAIVRSLEGRVARVAHSNPQKTRAIAEAKTDRVDAEILAQLLAADCLPDTAFSQGHSPSRSPDRGPDPDSNSPRSSFMLRGAGAQVESAGLRRKQPPRRPAPTAARY
jgi:hypothetical protein